MLGLVSTSLLLLPMWCVLLPLSCSIPVRQHVSNQIDEIGHDILFWDHNTVGLQTDVFKIVSQVVGGYAFHPKAASLLQSFRSELNYSPTPFALHYLASPSAAYAALASVVPTNSPFPQALGIVSSILQGAQTIASQDLGYLTKPTTTPPGPTRSAYAVIETEVSSRYPSSLLAIANATATSSMMAVFTGGAAIDTHVAYGAVAMAAGAVGMALL